MSTREPGEGQFGFDGTEVHPPPAVDLGRTRNSLSRVLTPEYMGLNPMDFTDVTEPMIRYSAPAELGQHLVDVPFDITKSPRAVTFFDPRLRRLRNVAVTPQEAKILPRFMNAFKENVELSTDAAIVNPFPTDADLARVERSSGHAQEAKLPKVKGLEQALSEQRNLLEKFVVASKGRNNGLSLFGSEAAMRERIAFIQAVVIANVIRAYGAQRRLNEEQMKMLDKAITVRLFLGPNRTQNFHEMMLFLADYTGQKLEATKQRRESLERGIGRTTLPTA